MTIETSLADFEQSRLDWAVWGQVYRDKGAQTESRLEKGAGAYIFTKNIIQLLFFILH